MPFVAESGLNPTGGASWPIALLLIALGVSAVLGGVLACPIPRETTENEIDGESVR